MASSFYLTILCRLWTTQGLSHTGEVLCNDTLSCMGENPTQQEIEDKLAEVIGEVALAVPVETGAIRAYIIESIKLAS